MTLWLAQPRLAGVSNKGLIWRQMTPFVQQCDENIATVSPMHDSEVLASFAGDPFRWAHRGVRQIRGSTL
jgi:hypothetical protein